MKKRFLVLHYIATILFLMLCMLWYDYRTKEKIDQSIEAYDTKVLHYWKDRLLPFYRNAGVKHGENPRTRAELFDPLIGLFEPIQKETKDNK